MMVAPTHVSLFDSLSSLSKHLEMDSFPSLQCCRWFFYEHCTSQFPSCPVLHLHPSLSLLHGTSTYRHSSRLSFQPPSLSTLPWFPGSKDDVDNSHLYFYPNFFSKKHPIESLWVGLLQLRSNQDAGFYINQATCRIHYLAPHSVGRVHICVCWEVNRAAGAGDRGKFPHHQYWQLWPLKTWVAQNCRG